MQCPVCKLDQVIVEFHGVELDMCIDGHGIWFDADELRQLFMQLEAPEKLQNLEARLSSLAENHDGPVRRCPRCGLKMLHVCGSGDAAAVILDRCPRGHGIWFDDGELEQVLRAEAGFDREGLKEVVGFLGQFTGDADNKQE